MRAQYPLPHGPTCYPFVIPKSSEKVSLILSCVKINKSDGAKPPTFRFDSWEDLARSLSAFPPDVGLYGLHIDHAFWSFCWPHASPDAWACVRKKRCYTEGARTAAAGLLGGEGGVSIPVDIPPPSPEPRPNYPAMHPTCARPRPPPSPGNLQTPMSPSTWGPPAAVPRVPTPGGPRSPRPTGP